MPLPKKNQGEQQPEDVEQDPSAGAKKRPSQLVVLDLKNLSDRTSSRLNQIPTNSSGQITVRDLATASEKTAQQTRSNYWLRVLVLALVAVLFLQAWATFGMSFWAVNLAKDTQVVDSKAGSPALTTNDKQTIMQVALASDSTIALRHAVVLDMKHLRSIEEITYTVPNTKLIADLRGDSEAYGFNTTGKQQSNSSNDAKIAKLKDMPKIKISERVLSVMKTLDGDTPTVTILTLGNNKLVITPANSVMIVNDLAVNLCGSLACSSFKVDDPSLDAGSLDEELKALVGAKNPESRRLVERAIAEEKAQPTEEELADCEEEAKKLEKSVEPHVEKTAGAQKDENGNLISKPKNSSMVGPPMMASAPEAPLAESVDKAGGRRLWCLVSGAKRRTHHCLHYWHCWSCSWWGGCSCGWSCHYYYTYWCDYTAWIQGELNNLRVQFDNGIRWAFNHFKNQFVSGFRAVMRACSEIRQAIWRYIPHFQNIIGWVSNSMHHASNIVMAVWNAVNVAFNFAWGLIRSIVMAIPVVRDLYMLVENIVRDISTFFSDLNIWSGIVTGFNGLLSMLGLSSAANDFGDNLAYHFTTAGWVPPEAGWAQQGWAGIASFAAFSAYSGGGMSWAVGPAYYHMENHLQWVNTKLWQTQCGDTGVGQCLWPEVCSDRAMLWEKQVNNEKTCVLSFAGSDNPVDFAHDLLTTGKTCMGVSYYYLGVAEGLCNEFNQIYNYMWNDIDGWRKLASCKYLMTTGHSLGGGLNILFAGFAHMQGRSPTGRYYPDDPLGLRSIFNANGIPFMMAPSGDSGFPIKVDRVYEYGPIPVSVYPLQNVMRGSNGCFEGVRFQGMSETLAKCKTSGSCVDFAIWAGHKQAAHHFDLAFLLGLGKGPLTHPLIGTVTVHTDQGQLSRSQATQCSTNWWSNGPPVSYGFGDLQGSIWMHLPHHYVNHVAHEGQFGMPVAANDIAWR